MKHSVIISAAALAATIQLVSCNVAEPDMLGEMNLTPMTFCAMPEESGSDTSKTAVNYQCQVLWQENDAIGIYAIDNRSANMKFTLKSGAGTKSAVFGGNGIESSRYFAMYPYNGSAQLNNGSSGNFTTFTWNGSTQKAVSNSFDPSFAIMAGSTSDSGISFKNLCAFVKISTDFPCKSIAISSPDANMGTTDVKLSFDENYVPSLVKTGTAANTAATLVAEGGGNIPAGTYYIALLPGSYYDIVVTITTPQNTVLTRTGRFWSSFKAGKVVNLGLFSASSFVNKDGFIGAGTSEDPYRIGNIQQFELMRELMSGSKSSDYVSKYYKQTADIDFKGAKSGFGSKGFNGTYDGDGHKLTNIVLKREVLNSSDYVYACALICKSNNAKIKNLTVEWAGFDSYYDARKIVYGGLIGVATSSKGDRVEIQNCTINRYMESSTSLVYGHCDVLYGGFVGAAEGNLKVVGCTNNLAVDARPETWLSAKRTCCIGGFVGKMWQDSGFDFWCNFNKCRNNANIELHNATDDCYVGGFVGYVYECASDEDCTLRLVNCINRGNITAACCSRSLNSFAGGFVGKHDSDGGDCGDPLIFNCMNSGTVGAAGNYAYTGGIFGWNYDNDTRICACANVGNITGDDASANYPRNGALCGNNKGEYYNCAFTSGMILYKTSATSDNIHSAYSIDDHSGQLSGDTMNSLAASVPQSLRTELSDKTGFSIESWTGLWNHQNQQGLNLNF